MLGSDTSELVLWYIKNLNRSHIIDHVAEQANADISHVISLQVYMSKLDVVLYNHIMQELIGLNCDARILAEVEPLQTGR